MTDFKYIFMLFVGAVVTACQSPRMVENRLVAAFGETMFDGNSVAHLNVAEGKKDHRLAKWESSVEISVVEGATEENVTLVQETLGQFAELTGLDITFGEPYDRSAQLQIFFGTDKDFVINGNERATCFARTRSDRRNRLVLSEVHVSQVADGKWQTDCIVHELLHAFGWRGHTHRVRSAISYMHGETELTRWDAYLMRTLYDRRLEPGTSKDDAMPVARAILHELLAEN